MVFQLLFTASDDMDGDWKPTRHDIETVSSDDDERMPDKKIKVEMDDSQVGKYFVDIEPFKVTLYLAFSAKGIESTY